MCSLVPFEIAHLKPLLEEPMNRHLSHWSADDYAYPKALAESKFVFPITITIGDKVGGCFFLVEVWNGRAHAVCVLSQNIKNSPAAFYRMIKRSLALQPYDRIEFDSPVDFDLGHRRAKFLGFKQEVAVAKKYLPDGSDASVDAWGRE